MYSFDVIKELLIPLGTILRLSENQSERWERVLKPIGPVGWFQVRGEVIFRRGESVHFQDMPDVITEQALVAWQTWPGVKHYDPRLLTISDAGESYCVLKPFMCFAAGTVLRVLSGDVRRQGEKKRLDNGWYRAVEELSFTEGDVLQFPESPSQSRRRGLLKLRYHETGLQGSEVLEEVWTYTVSQSMTVSSGFILRLTEAQAYAYASRLKPLLRAHWYILQEPIHFRPGECLQFNAEPSDLLSCLTPQAVETVIAEGNKTATPASLPLAVWPGVPLSASACLSARQQAIWALLREESSLGMQQLQAHYPHLNRRTLHRDLQKLVSRGCVRVTGVNRYARYGLAQPAD